ncbi:MAG: hypothetical protein J7K75_05550 [Desulfuromonas sp.]|nr:hypothetical protein [Desulfuromonas sp.]
MAFKTGPPGVADPLTMSRFPFCFTLAASRPLGRLSFLFFWATELSNLIVYRSLLYWHRYAEPCWSDTIVRLFI